MTHPKKKKIIWAVDISQSPKEVQNIIAELKIWAARTNSDVLPVSVFPKALLDIPLSMIKKRKEWLVHESENDVNRFLRAAGADGFLKPEILLCSSNSHRSMAQALIDYADAHKASMIFANSHTKKLWNTFLIGGFALTLTSLSHIPVMLMTLKAKPSKNIKTIIFPTDFSQDSRNALDQLKPMAKSFKSSVVLFNQVENLNFMRNPVQRADKIDTELQMKKLKKERTEAAKRLTEKLLDAGIPSTVLVKNEAHSLWSDIDRLAKSKKAGLVALSSNGGPALQTILGSVTRNIVASAKYPVLVFHEPRPVRRKRQPMNSKYRRTVTERATALHS